VVLNQLSQYLTPAATFSVLIWRQYPTTACLRLPPVEYGQNLAATTEVGTVTGGVTVGSLAEVTTWGQLLSSAPVFFNVTTGGLSAGADVCLQCIHEHQCPRHKYEGGPVLPGAPMNRAGLIKVCRTWPVLATIAIVVVGLLVWLFAYFVPQGKKLSSLKASETQLQSEQLNPPHLFDNKTTHPAPNLPWSPPLAL